LEIPVAFASALILKPYAKSFKGPTLINESLTVNEKVFCTHKDKKEGWDYLKKNVIRKNANQNKIRIDSQS
jgi:uracil DNA glycosylase